MKTILLTFVLFAAALSAEQFQVNIDTTSLNTQNGTVTVQFGPAIFFNAYETGTATVDAFSLGGGSFNSIAFGPSGGATGTLPGPLVIVNSGFFNGIVYNATFGTTASFLVDFTGNALTASGQTNLSTFAVTLEGTTTLSAVADLFGNGVVDTSFSNSPEVTWGPAASEVPEPATFGLMALGLAAAAFVTRRR